MARKCRPAAKPRFLPASSRWKAEIRRPGRSAAGDRSSLSPVLDPESARGAPVWPARSSGRPGAPSQGQGFAAHPVAVALHGLGMEAGPPFQVRPGAASAPPASAGVRSGLPFKPAPGADGTTVRASQPPDLARRGQGEDGGGTPPKRRAGRPARGPRRTDRIQCGPRRSRALSGPPWSASGGWGSGREVPPRGAGGFQGGACSTPLENEPDRLRSAISKTDGPQSLDLLRDAPGAAGVDAGRRYHDLAFRPSRRPAGARQLPARPAEGRRERRLEARPPRPEPSPPGRHRAGPVSPRRGPGSVCRRRAQVDTTTAAGRLVFGILRHRPGSSGS